MAKTQFPFLIAKWICSDCIWKGRFNNDHHQLYSSDRERVVKLGTSTKVMLKVLQCCNPFLLHTVLNRILLTHFIFSPTGCISIKFHAVKWHKHLRRAESSSKSNLMILDWNLITFFCLVLAISSICLSGRLAVWEVSALPRKIRVRIQQTNREVNLITMMLTNLKLLP